MGPVPGMLCRDQQDWILSVLPKWKKPVFVCSHFPLHELKAGDNPLGSLLTGCPNVAGYIHGHDHRRYVKDIGRSKDSSKMLRSLCLPSTGHWGDIGYALMRIRDGNAMMTLREREYFHPTPVPKDPAVAESWKTIVRDRQGLKCTFVLPNAGRGNGRTA